MENFNELRRLCKESSALSGKVVDRFLLYYSAQREGLNKEMDQRLLRFRLVTKEFEKSWINIFKAQYIGHRIFKENGFIKRYLQHTAIKELPTDQRNFLEQQSVIPWKYSFSTIIGKPESDFYEMEDAFTGETYLIYSPSVSQILSKGPVSLWFNLIGFNGSCWQSYGPVTSFSSFGPDDIFFFATELNPAIETEEALMADVENNPIPYLMLISGSTYPLIINGKDEILQVFAEHYLESFDSTGLEKDFKIEYARGIYRLSLGAWGGPPHFAQAYYVEERELLLVNSLTERGFQNLVKKLNQHGFGLPTEPDIRVHLSMLVSIKHVLGKDIRLNPYEEVFKIETTPEGQVETDKLNRLLALALSVINAGRKPDFRALSKEVGVDEETAREIVNNTINRINKLNRKIKNS
ncbi:MAG: hypothetical protein ABI416_10860 [Ginsengibacter sp.]